MTVTADTPQAADHRAIRAIRVALLTDANVFAGTEQHILDLAIALRNEGVEPSIGCPLRSPLATRAIERAIQVIPIPERGMANWRTVSELKRLLGEDRIDILHAHNGRTCLAAAIAMSLAKRGRLVTTQHFLKPSRTSRSGLGGALSSVIHRWIGRRAVATIAISQAVQNEILARADTDSNRIVVIPNGIAASWPPVQDRQAARRSLEIPTDIPVVFCAARLQPEKDVLSLVRAMAVAGRLLPGALCLVAGEGEERARLAREIAKLGLGRQVKLLGFRQDISTLLMACDLFVLPSLAEPFGLVLLEAMSHGRAVVATRGGGPLEIVIEGTTGLLVPPGDPSSLAAAMLQLLTDRAQCEEMGRQGISRIREHFSASQMALATATVYKEAMQSAPS